MCKREEVCAKYLRPDDAAIIEDWARREKVSISFRPAGQATLKCLARGAGAKPHEISDKSLKIKGSDADKLSKKDKKHNAAVNAFFNDFFESKDIAENLLMGLVGHWSYSQAEENSLVDGIYLTSLGAKIFGDGAAPFGKGEETLRNQWKNFFVKENYSVKDNGAGMLFLLLDTKERKAELISFFNALYGGQAAAERKDTDIQYYLFTRLFFSGDYDVHDLLKDREVVVTKQDMELLKALQQELMEGRRAQLRNRFGQGLDFEGEKAQDYYRVQHGPQYNYVAQMLNENLKLFEQIKSLKSIDTEMQRTYLKELNILVRSVINMDPPVAMYDHFATGAEKWDIFDNPAAVQKFYSDKGLHVKSTWTDQSERDEHIIHVIKMAIKVRFPGATSRSEVNLKVLLKEVPQFEELYGESLQLYAEKAMNELGLSR